MGDTVRGNAAPILFKTPAGRQYWTDPKALLESGIAEKTLHALETYLLHGALLSGAFALLLLAWAWFYFTRTGRGLGSNQFLRGARFGTVRQVRSALRWQARGSFEIGGVNVPDAFEPEHILICGAPGTGKTNIIVKMLDGIRKQKRRAIVYDTAGTFVEKFYRPGIDVLLNPLDARSDAWSPWVDVPRDYHYDQIAESTKLAAGLVSEWTRLKPENRAQTNILVLENATRLIVNTKVREALKTEGAIAAEEARLDVLTPAGLSTQEKHFARFYSGGQVIMFARDNAGLGISRDAEYRVTGTSRDARGRQVVTLIDENGRTIRWDPGLGRASQVNVFRSEKRDLAKGDRIQWRLVDHDLGVRNADRGTVERLDGSLATIRWDRDGRSQDIDLGVHKNWDHGYAETVYSAQSKTYDRVYVLAPVNSALVTGQNFYTAITRARFGVKLWTESEKRLVDKLERRSGEKTSALEGLGRLGRDNVQGRTLRHGARLEGLREQQRGDREVRKERIAAERARRDAPAGTSIGAFLAARAHEGARTMDRWLESLISCEPSPQARSEPPPPQQQPSPQPTNLPGGGHDR